MQDDVGLGRARRLSTLREIATPAALTTRRERRRATVLGLLLRRVRRRERETIVEMSKRLSAHEAGDLMGLAPETLSAFERGDAAPGPHFLKGLQAAYMLSSDETAAFEQAVFLASDPFLRVGAEAAGDETEEEALNLLDAPILEDLQDASQDVATLLRRRPISRQSRASRSGQTVSGAQLFDAARKAGAALRAAIAEKDGRVRNEALTDGAELLAPAPIRVIFADAPLSSALFSGANDAELAFSGPTASSHPTQSAADLGPEGGYVCLRSGALKRLADGDPIVRFALLHEIGRRCLGQGPTPTFHERHGRDAAMIWPPGRQRRGGSRERLEKALGAPHPRQRDVSMSLREAVRDKAAATLFAFYALTDPTTFSPTEERLDDWAAHWGAPAALALSFYRQTPEAFGAQVDTPKMLTERLTVARAPSARS